MTSSSNKQLWTYKINFENGTLPLNGLVKVDFIINNNYTYANCYFFDSVLNCETSEIKNSSLILLSYEKKYGSITWKNMDKKDIIIPVNISLDYIEAKNLTFIGDVWTFIIELEISEVIKREWTFIIKIKYGEAQKLGNAYCSLISDNSKIFECKAQYKKQKKTDVIIITPVSDKNIKWKNWNKDIYIPIRASLNIKKVYGLMYNEKNKWEFKIQTDEDFPTNSALILDVLYDENKPDTATCIYNSKILFCQRDSDNQSPKETFKINPVQVKGTITINNKGVIENKIFPLTVLVKFKRAYGKFFSDFWNFYVEIDDFSPVPIDSYVLLDILLNKTKAAAKCELPSESENKKILFCYIDDKNTSQSRFDEIIVNFDNDLGSITWDNNSTEFNGTILESNPELNSFYLSDAFDMDFVEGIWRFKIKGIPEREVLKGEIYTIEMSYLILNGEYDTVAKCWNREGGNEGREIIFLCNVEYDHQNEEGSIKMKYIQTSVSNLKWNGGMHNNYKITLKTALYLVRAYDLSFDNSWKFKIDVYGGLLPPGSKVIVDIKNGNLYNKSIICDSKDSSNIICDTKIQEKNTGLIQILEKRISSSSVEWLGTNQTDYLIFLNVDIYYIRVYNLEFINDVWRFFIYINETIVNGSKLSVDILYDNIEATATCYSNNNVLTCILDIKIQSAKALVRLNHIKSLYSSINWINLSTDEGIDLVTSLSYINADNLRFEHDIWYFDVFISEADCQNIPNYSKLIIDIYYEIEYKTYTAIAICYLRNKKIYCKTILSCEKLIKLKLKK